MRRFRGEKRKANVPEGAPAPKEMRDEIREYCSGVCGRIRWKKARAAVAEELASHICDQKEAYVQTGMEEDEATHKAVLDMGDPREVGEALDRIHRPQPQGKFLFFAFLALAGGLAARFLAVSVYGDPVDLSVSDFRAAAAALVLICVIYRIDFSPMLRHGRAVCLIALVFILLCGFLLFDVNGVQGYFGGLYSYISVGFSILFTPLYAFFLCSVVRKETGFRAVAAGAAAYLLPGIFLTVCSMAALCLIFYGVTTCAVTAIFAFHRRATRHNIFRKIMILQIVLTGALLLLHSFLHNGQPLYIFWLWGEEWHSWNTELVQLLPEIPFLGPGPGAEELDSAGIWISEANLKGDFLLFALMLRFGWSAFFVVIGLFAWVLAAGFRRAGAQRSEPARMMTYSVMIVLTAQVICYVLCNFGVMLGTSLSLPLFSGGEALLLADAALIGFLLSVFRTGQLFTDMRPAAKRTKVTQQKRFFRKL